VEGGGGGGWGSSETEKTAGGLEVYLAAVCDLKKKKGIASYSYRKRGETKKEGEVPLGGKDGGEEATLAEFIANAGGSKEKAMAIRHRSKRGKSNKRQTYWSCKETKDSNDKLRAPLLHQRREWRVLPWPQLKNEGRENNK